MLAIWTGRQKIASSSTPTARSVSCWAVIARRTASCLSVTGQGLAFWLVDAYKPAGYPFGKTVKGLTLWVRFSKLRTTVN